MTPDEIQAFRLTAMFELVDIASQQRLPMPSGLRTGVTLDTPTINLSFDDDVAAALWIEFFALEFGVYSSTLGGRSCRVVTGSGVWRGWHIEVSGSSELAGATTELIPAVAS